MNKKRITAYIVSFLVTFIFLVYFLLNLDWVLLSSILAKLRWGWLGLAILTYLVNILLRAMRFQSLIYSRPVQLRQLIPISAIHNLLMYLMPAKTGDISYIMLVKDRLNLPLTEGTATLLAVRFYDFSVITVVLAGILPIIRNDIPEWVLQPARIFLLAASLGIAGVITFLAISSTKKLRGRYKNPVVNRLVAGWNNLIAGLVEIRNSRSSLRIALLTSGIWLCIYTNNFLIGRSLGADISYVHIAVISIVMVPLTLLPLQGFANVGTHEIGWASVLVAFGYTYDTALAISVGSHFLLLASIVVSAGIVSLIAYAVTRNRQNIIQEND